jgi:hypothetical protein
VEVVIGEHGGYANSGGRALISHLGDPGHRFLAARVAYGAGCAGRHHLHLNNGVIKVGIDATQMGGAITYLSESTSTTNLINIHDRGRAVQQSYYAGAAVDRDAEGQHPVYSPWPWNRITAGDVYGNPGSVIASKVTARKMYVKTAPLLWDMQLEPCECVLETWITLEGRRVRVHNRLTATRTDNRWTVLSRDQELPAVYPIANLHRVVS